jgi:hypothetical protein
VIYTLPRDVEGTAVKVNALRALSTVYQMAEGGEVSPLILIDNNRIQELFRDVSLARFWPKANQFLADLCEKLGIEPGGTTADGLIKSGPAAALPAMDGYTTSAGSFSRPACSLSVRTCSSQ